MSEEEQDRNSISDIRKFLNKDNPNPVSMQEFSEWWKTLSDEEKAEFKNTALPE